METAPRDRTHILMLTDRGMVEAFWVGGAYSPTYGACVGGWVNEIEADAAERHLDA